MRQARVVSLADAHARRREHVESVTLKLILKLLAAVDWYSPASVASFTRQAHQAVGDAQQAVGGATIEYLDSVLDELGVGRKRSVPSLPARLRKVDPAVEWARPGEQYRYAKSQGASDQEAAAAAQRRAESLTDTDITLAMQHATVLRLQDYPRVIGYRRVIHPEMAKGGTCGLCAVASDRRYFVDRLMPVHDRCNCGVLPITTDHDPGSALNAADLKKLYDEAGSTGAEDLKRTRITVEDHSELGPRLRPRPARIQLDPIQHI